MNNTKTADTSLRDRLLEMTVQSVLRLVTAALLILATAVFANSGILSELSFNLATGELTAKLRNSFIADSSNAIKDIEAKTKGIPLVSDIQGAIAHFDKLLPK